VVRTQETERPCTSLLVALDIEALFFLVPEFLNASMRARVT
jgi:hypothetical protein